MESKDSVTIVIIRHGETTLNKEHRIRGWSDVPLDKEARTVIEETAEKLKGKLDVLVTSDLERASDTAKIISDITDTPIEEKSIDYRPWDVGEYTGEPQEEVYKQMENYARNEPEEKIPGGESFNDFKNRFLDAIVNLKEEYPGQVVGVVTHHRGDRLFDAWRAEGFPDDYSIDMSKFLIKDGTEPGESAEPVEF